MSASQVLSNESIQGINLDSFFDDTALDDLAGCSGTAGTLGTLGTATGCLGSFGTAGTYGCS